MKKFFEEIRYKIPTIKFEKKQLMVCLDLYNQKNLDPHTFAQSNAQLNFILENIEFVRHKLDRRENKDHYEWQLILARPYFVSVLSKLYGYTTEKEFIREKGKDWQKFIKEAYEDKLDVSEEKLSALLTGFTNGKTSVLLLGFCGNTPEDKLYLSIIHLIVVSKSISLITESKQYKDFVIEKGLGFRSKYKHSNLVDTKHTELEVFKDFVDFNDLSVVNYSDVELINHQLERELTKTGTHPDTLLIPNVQETYSNNMQAINQTKQKTLTPEKNLYYVDEEGNFAGYLPEVIEHKAISPRIFGYLAFFNGDYIGGDYCLDVIKKYNFSKKGKICAKAKTSYNHCKDHGDNCLPKIESERKLIFHKKLITKAIELMYNDERRPIAAKVLENINDDLYEQYQYVKKKNT